MPIADQNSSEEAPVKNGKDKSVKTPAAKFPQRYTVRETDSGRCLVCVEAPNLYVHIEPGLTVSATATAKSAPGTIYLDGVAQTGPLLDHNRQVYNFDHHEGCVRSFTLSTSEQVLLMVKKGLDLRSRDWKIYANDPDLDAILAIWLLLNHVRINEQESIRENILVALVRLEGLIDAIGLEMRAFSALPPAMLNQIQRVIDHLRRKELQIKKDGRWEQIDFIEYAADILHDIDQILFVSGKVGDLLGIEELARINLSENHVAVVVRSDLGIYEIEPQLKKIYGGSLGLVALRRSSTGYTLRKIDPFMDLDLDAVYERLNFMDPTVKCGARNSRWGGSADIGGSPREIGTQLTPEEIVGACRDAFKKNSFYQQILRFLFITITCSGILAIAGLAATYSHSWKWFSKARLPVLAQNPSVFFSVLLILMTSILLAGVSNRRLWQFGFMLPVGKTWFQFLPIALLAAFAGGAWAPMGKATGMISTHARMLPAVILLPFAVEYLFRGVLHGMLAQKERVQNCSGKYFLSWPNTGTSLLYAAFLTLLSYFQSGLVNTYTTASHITICFAAFCFSISLGFVRERSHSLFASYLFHLASILFVVYLPVLT
jgi:hypothetical protein